MSADFEWQDPPPSPKRTPVGVWAERLDALRKHPGKWAHFGPHSQGMGSHVQRGKVGGAAPGEFEATTRANGTTKPELYVRYVGKPNLKAAAS